MELSPDDARALIGPRAQYYLTRWEGIDQGRAPSLGFNWAAFFGSGLWLLYRRMYRYFWMLMGSLVAIQMARNLLFPSSPRIVNTLINLLLATAFGTFGSYWYYAHIRRQWQIAAASGAPTPEGLARRGGTRWWPVLLTIVVSVSVMYLAAISRPA